MGQLVNGRWVYDDVPTDDRGRFVRAESGFRDWVTADGSSGYPAEAGRYHLYVSYACPWATGVLILRHLKGLTDAVSLSVVDWYMGPDGWRFGEAPGCIPDTVNGAAYLREVYTQARPDYTGRVTVPVLWDKQTGTIVNNESRDIIRMFDTEFDAVGDDSVTYCPERLRERVDAEIDAIYRPINNGVYRAGFARTQAAYEEAVRELFAALDRYEERLSGQRYLCGDVLTEADWRLYTTLSRFDPVYVTHFKCNLRRLVDYPHLWAYVRELYQVPGIAEITRFDHIKRHYFGSHESLNPRGIVPLGPELDFAAPHGRERLGTRRSAAG